MINNNVYRPNVGIVIYKIDGKVLLAKRNKQFFWQFPQGGINLGETAEQAMYRELFEEVGLTRNDICILTTTKNWLRYKIPSNLIRWNTNPVYIGQKQKWFLLKLLCQDKNINTQCGGAYEFDDWRWVSFWYPVRHIVSFKRDVYRRVMKEFSRKVMIIKN